MKLYKKLYLENRGSACPVCQSLYEIEGGPVSIEDGQAIQECWCHECDSEWTDIYNLSNIELCSYPDEYKEFLDKDTA